MRKIIEYTLVSADGAIGTRRTGEWETSRTTPTCATDWASCWRAMRC